MSYQRVGQSLTLQPFTHLVCIYSSPPAGHIDTVTDMVLDGKVLSGPLPFIRVLIGGFGTVAFDI